LARSEWVTIVFEGLFRDHFYPAARPSRKVTAIGHLSNGNGGLEDRGNGSLIEAFFRTL
jgi:hypothetical protein